MLRRHCQLSYKHILLSDSDTESDDDLSKLAVAMARQRSEKVKRGNSRSKRNKGKEKKVVFSEEDNQVIAKPFKPGASVDRDALVELAREYQKTMKRIPIPRARLREGVVVNWQGLVKTLKNSYGQPLHYLTFRLCKQWDQSRFGSEDEGKPLDTIFDWSKAETTIWSVERIHRICTSPIHLAMLWVSDPEYHAFVDEVIPFS